MGRISTSFWDNFGADGPSGGGITLNHNGGSSSGTIGGNGALWFSFEIGVGPSIAEVGPLEIEVVDSELGRELVVGFAAQGGWSYGLETSTDLQNWSPAPEAVFSQDNGAGTLVLPVDGQDELYARIIGSQQ